MSFAGRARVHFIGIGGAGMSAIAKVLVEQGVRVSGSDLKSSRATNVLEAMGADIRIGHDAAFVDGADLVVHSAAIPESNSELSRARTDGIETMTRGEALAALLADRKSVVIAGTHGKTTTTSMIASILRRAGRDPTYLVGGGLNDVGTNARFGRDDVAVAESDESDGSFLLLRPHVGVVTNVEADHLDRWGSVEALREAFGDFIAAVQPDGVAVVPAHEDDLVQRARAEGRRVRRWGDGGEISAIEVTLRSGASRFALTVDDDRTDIELRVPGAHNVANAVAAAASCVELGISLDAIARGLSAYQGVERRFEIRGKARGITIIDDYAHHPTEVQATISAARPGPWQRLIAVFQPHRFSRTAAMSDAFGPAFAHADRVVVTDVYGAGEHPVPGVTGKLVADSACKHLPGRTVAYLPHRGELVSYLDRVARDGDAVMTLGAGDITAVADELLARWRRT